MKDLERLLTINIKRPFGIFLSGGLDSGLLAALLKPDFAITCTFSEYDELEYAKAITEHLGIKHYIYTPPKENVRIEFENAVNIIGKPINSVSIYPWYKCLEYAKSLGAERMVGGEGGDENFLGYSRYIILNQIAQLYRVEELQNYKPMLDMLFGSVNDLHEKLVGLKAPEFPKENTVSAIAKWEYENTLPDVVLMEKKLSEHFGIEFYWPWMQKSVHELALSLPESQKLRGGETKACVRKIAINYLPKDVVWRKQKSGFVSPILDWLGFDRKYKFDKSAYVNYQKQILCL